jgi:hypothetical protein
MKIKISLVMIVQCLLIGIMSPIYAQSSFIQITSNQPAVLYLDNTRITKYVNSRLLDGWVKKIMTAQDKALIKKNKTSSKAEKDQAALLAKTSYQLIHQQFDPINFKYKVLEIYSYDGKGQFLFSSTGQSYWLTIPADSIEEKTMMGINDYIQNNIDKVIMK